MLFKIIGILIILVLMLFLMYVIELYKINMNPMKKPVKTEEIIVETFVSDNSMVKESNSDIFDFCEEYKSNNARLDQSCKSIKDFGSCMEKNCCIWGGQKGLPDIKKNGNCLLGNENGPIFGGSAFDPSEYYFQNNRYPLKE